MKGRHIVGYVWFLLNYLIILSISSLTREVQSDKSKRLICLQLRNKLQIPVMVSDLHSLNDIPCRLNKPPFLFTEEHSYCWSCWYEGGSEAFTRWISFASLFIAKLLAMCIAYLDCGYHRWKRSSNSNPKKPPNTNNNNIHKRAVAATPIKRNGQNYTPQQVQAQKEIGRDLLLNIQIIYSHFASSTNPHNLTLV